MGKSLDWLKEQVDKVVLDEKLFRLYISNDKYILGAHLKNNNGPNYFSISTIYDSILEYDWYSQVTQFPNHCQRLGIIPCES